MFEKEKEKYNELLKLNKEKVLSYDKKYREFRRLEIVTFFSKYLLISVFLYAIVTIGEMILSKIAIDGYQAIIKSISNTYLPLTILIIFIIAFFKYKKILNQKNFTLDAIYEKIIEGDFFSFYFNEKDSFINERINNFNAIEEALKDNNIKIEKKEENEPIDVSIDYEINKFIEKKNLSIMDFAQKFAWGAMCGVCFMLMNATIYLDTNMRNYYNETNMLIICYAPFIIGFIIGYIITTIIQKKERKSLEYFKKNKEIISKELEENS